jgi:hypothetical protein
MISGLPPVYIKNFKKIEKPVRFLSSVTCQFSPPPPPPPPILTKNSLCAESNSIVNCKILKFTFDTLSFGGEESFSKYFTSSATDDQNLLAQFTLFSREKITNGNHSIVIIKIQ